MNVTGNTILITGGTSGIGLEFTKQFIELGNTVIITGRDQAKLDNVSTQFSKVHTIQSDVSDPKGIVLLYQKVIQDFPALNILINNAGIMRTINLHNQASDLGELTSEIETNLCGPIWMVNQFLPHLKEKSGSAIVNVSSGLAFVPLPLSPVYCATKAGIHSFTLSLRVQLKNTSVKVFELAPPATQTPLLDNFEREDMKDAHIMKVDKLVKAAISGMKNDEQEIHPGFSKMLYIMSRFAPQLGLKLLSKPVERMLKKPKP